MRPLPWIIAGVVVAGMVPSIALAVAAPRVRIAKVDALPYQTSAHVDADHAALAHLRAGGFSWQVRADGDRLVATIDGAKPADARLVLLRPDDPSADAAVAWTDTSQPLTVAPGRPGRWRVRLEGSVDGVRARLVESSVDVGM